MFSAWKYKKSLLFLFLGLFLSAQVWASVDQSQNAGEDHEEILTLSQGWFIHSSSEHPPDFSSPKSQPVALPDVWEESRYAGGHSGWYRFTVEKNTPPETLWGIYLPKLNMNAAVYFNGHFLGDGGSFEEPLGRNWNRPLLFSLSPGLWKPGINTVFVRLAGYPRNILLAPVQVGPLPSLQEAYDFRTLLQNRIIAVLFPMTLTVAGAVFMIAIGFRKRRETLYIWFGVAVVAWSMSSLNLFVQNIFLPLRTWEVIAHASTFWWNFCNAIFVLRFLKIKRPRMEKLFAVHAVTGTLILYVVPLSQIGQTAMLWGLGALLIAGYYITLVLQQLRLQKQKEVAWLGIAMVLIWMTFLHDWFNMAGIFSMTSMSALFINNYASPFIFFFIAWHITLRLVKTLNESDQLNRELEDRVEKAKQALEAGHQKILAMEKKSVLVEERSRVSREIHDGLGGNFSNAITLVDLITREGGNPEKRLSHLKTILSDGFTELRNLITTMEGEVSTLEDLSSLMDEKTRKVADLASLDCETVIDIGDGTQLIPQGLSLNLLRILQEGLTNIVKHAQASRIDTRIVFCSGKLLFELRDDGLGFVTEGTSTGYGLRNMDKRCRDMGTELKIHSTPGEGTLLSLDFSLPSSRP